MWDQYPGQHYINAVEGNGETISMEQMFGYFVHSNFQTSQGTASIVASVDSLTVVPEPVTIALLGLGGLAMIRKKRKA
jgi:hypothetical protein